jgi:hypothetical protein
MQCTKCSFTFYLNSCVVNTKFQELVSVTLSLGQHTSTELSRPSSKLNLAKNDRGIVVRFPAAATDYSVLPKRPDPLQSHPTSGSMGTRVPSLGLQRTYSKAAHNMHVAPKLTVRGGSTPLSNISYF